MTKIKICGLTREEDIAFANICRPDYIGFVFAEKSKRYVSVQQAARLSRLLDTEIIPVGVFVNAPVELVVTLLQNKVIRMAQLHGQEDSAYLKELRRRTDQPLLQAFSIAGYQDAEAAERSLADYILLDQEVGGSGKPFDWKYGKAVQRPIFLAGGLNPDNVTDAVSALHPFAVDVSSGVETGKNKDIEKMKAFVRAVRKEA